MGYLHAGLARDLTGTLDGAQSRFAITDEQGQLTHCGTTRARPAGTPTRSAASKAIVELQVPADVLRALAADPGAQGGWAGVVADLVRRLDRDTGSADPYRADANRRARRRAAPLPLSRGVTHDQVRCSAAGGRFTLGDSGIRCPMVSVGYALSREEFGPRELARLAEQEDR